jgi:hypothetical protein
MPYANISNHINIRKTITKIKEIPSFFLPFAVSEENVPNIAKIRLASNRVA